VIISMSFIPAELRHLLIIEKLPLHVAFRGRTISFLAGKLLI
jgi:hypothetical protein